MVSSAFSMQAIASFLSIITATNAHMIMKTPIPYGRGVINNSPLDDSGSDFPCKNIFDMTDPVNDVNHLVPGVSNTLSFTGSAVHGGGSCQVSLTTDLRPTKNSKWMVIKSIEGGCPANVAGNLPADPSGSGASTFEYTVPQGFPEGEYTIAWTWFNKIGNREMYMNCGRANIANSKKRYAPAAPKVEHRAADYPDIFKANLKIFNGCTTIEGQNIGFPEPGSDVTQGGGAVTPFSCGAAAAAGGSGSGSGAGSSSSASAGSGSPTSAAAGTSAMSATATSMAAGPTGGAATGPAGGAGSTATGGFASGGGSSPQSTGTPGVFAPGAASQTSAAAAPQPTSQSPAASSVAPAQPVPSSSSGSGSGSSTPMGSTAAGTACSEEGAWLCSSDGMSFQRCASGMWSAPMQVAAGTTCTPGQSMTLGMKVVMPGSVHKRDSAHRNLRRVLPF